MYTYPKCLTICECRSHLLLLLHLRFHLLESAEKSAKNTTILLFNVCASYRSIFYSAPLFIYVSIRYVLPSINDTLATVLSPCTKQNHGFPQERETFDIFSHIRMTNVLYYCSFLCGMCILCFFSLIWLYYTFTRAVPSGMLQISHRLHIITFTFTKCSRSIAQRTHTNTNLLTFYHIFRAMCSIHYFRNSIKMFCEAIQQFAEG